MRGHDLEVVEEKVPLQRRQRPLFPAAKHGSADDRKALLVSLAELGQPAEENGAGLASLCRGRPVGEDVAHWDHQERHARLREDAAVWKCSSRH